MTASRADRDLAGQVTIDTDTSRVWAVLTDPRTMPRASPELFAITRRRNGPYQVGETFIGWNRRRLIIWPTVNTVVTVSPIRELSWHTRSSGATWTYTLSQDGDRTVLRECRHIRPQGPPAVAKWFAVLLGGTAGHADELETHLPHTLRRIKEMAERPR